jgi:hypothetical protein
MTEGHDIPENNGAPAQKALDTATVEVLTHTLFRTLFREGVRVPIRLSGLADVDVVVKDDNVLLNVGRVEAEILPLSVWRVTLAYRGHTVVEYGRGVKNDVKVHVLRLGFLLLTSWVERRRRYKTRGLTGAARDRATAAVSLSERRPGSVAEPPV